MMGQAAARGATVAPARANVSGALHDIDVGDGGISAAASEQRACLGGGQPHWLALIGDGFAQATVVAKLEHRAPCGASDE